MNAGAVAAVAALAMAIGGVVAAPARAADLELDNTSATQLEAMMKAGQLTSVQLTQDYLNRIAALNLRGPAVNAVRSLNPDALKEAAASDALRASGVTRPLEGLPVLLKDNIDVAGMPTTASSIVLEHSVPDKDSVIVSKLKAAGAVILGKANLTEFAAWVSDNQQSGNGSLSGQVLNPYDTSTDPGGSSSGPGVAAATGLAALTIGSDTEGSIVSPSTQNGDVGVRPSTGLVSRTGVVPISHTQDTLGPITQTVSDAAMVLNAVAGPDPADDTTEDPTRPTGVDYLAGLKPDALQGARIGVVAGGSAQYAAAKAELSALGATAVQITLPSYTTAQSIQQREFRRDLDNYLSRLPSDAPIKSFDEALAYLEDHPEEGLKYGDAGRFGASAQYNLAIPSEEAEYEQVRDYEVNRARSYLDNLFNQGAGTSDDLDAIMQTPLGLTSQAAFAGYPIVTVPAGFSTTTHDPTDVMFTGRRWSEAKLLGYAYAYEQATHLRKPPAATNPASWRCVPGEPGYDPVGCGPFSGFAGPLTDALVTPALDLEHMDIAEIQRRFANGTLTSTELVKAYLDRIRFVNNQGPGIDAVTAVDPDATAEAAAADAARASGQAGGPLAGVPVLLSNTIDVAGMATSAGSMALQNLDPSQDAELVTRLKAAGAIILGKTNVSELEGLVSTGMPTGYSALSGQVLNPYDMRSPVGGSDAGAVAAAAAGLAAATVGIETDETSSGTTNATNTTAPGLLAAAVNDGVVAMHPTFGLVGRSGVLGLSRSQETPAPAGRDVMDVAQVLDAMVGPDPADPATANAPVQSPDYAAQLDKTSLKGVRIGVIAPTSGSSLTPFTAAESVLTSAGATLVPLTAPARPTTAGIVDREAGRDVAAYLAEYGGAAPVQTLSDLAAYGDAHPADEEKFGQSRLVSDAAINLNDPATQASYQADLAAGQTNSRAYLDNLLANAGAPVQAILSLTATTDQVADRGGYPEVSVPAGYDPTLRRPVSIAFTGTAGDDAKLLSFAYAYERAALVWRSPPEVNPQTWHCVAPVVYLPRTCGPGEPVTPAAAPAPAATPTPPAPLPQPKPAAAVRQKWSVELRRSGRKLAGRLRASGLPATVTSVRITGYDGDRRFAKRTVKVTGGTVSMAFSGVVRGHTAVLAATPLNRFGREASRARMLRVRVGAPLKAGRRGRLLTHALE